MPEMTFTVTWPDGRTVDCYSPSLVMHDYLREGVSYPVSTFVGLTSEALDVASARVKEKFGFECTSAAAQKAEIEATSAGFAIDDHVRVLRMHPPLPTRESGATR